jgi:hypothetical protein
MSQLTLLDPITQHLACGTIVRVSNTQFQSHGALGVVLVDRGSHHVNVAPLGGYRDRYMSLPRRALTVVDPADLAVRPF